MKIGLKEYNRIFRILQDMQTILEGSDCPIDLAVLSVIKDSVYAVREAKGARIIQSLYAKQNPHIEATARNPAE
jgi:hypothetical protein